MLGARSPNPIVMQFCAGVDILDLVIPANFGSHRFRRFRIAGVEFQTFPLTFSVVLVTLWHYRASVCCMSQVNYCQRSMLKCWHSTLCLCKECADNVTISPSRECVMQDPPTTFMCSATYGYPGDPTYSWTHVFSGMTNTGSEQSYSGATAVGDHTLTCSATYTHTACPDFQAVCSATTEVRVFGK